MIKHLALLLAATAAPAIAQVSPAPPARPVVVAPWVASLRDDTLANDHYAFDIVEGLTTEIGQRLAATEAEARARDWAVKRLSAMGFANVHVEPYTMPIFQRGVETAEIVSPFPQKLVLTALGNSGATSPAGVTAQVVQFDSIDSLRAAPDSTVRGKIVFIDHHMTANQDGSGYSQFGQPRRVGPTIAGKKGAIAIVVRSAGTDHHRYGHTGAQTLDAGVTSIPAAALSIPDAEQLVRVMARGKPVTMHLTLTPKYLGNGPSGNVVAEVRGRDPSLPAILVAGHLDSWDLGTGAIDDAAGVGIVTAAAKHIMDAGRPLRTIRIVWFGAEEPGLLGANAYQKAHAADRYFAVGESDEGADRVWKIDTKIGADHQAEANMLFAAVAPLGIVTGKSDTASGSDVDVMIDAGAPGVTLHQDATRYFDLHHTPDDTLDKIDPAQLRQNVAAWTTMLAVLSGGVSATTQRKQ